MNYQMNSSRERQNTMGKQNNSSKLYRLQYVVSDGKQVVTTVIHSRDSCHILPHARQRRSSGQILLPQFRGGVDIDMIKNSSTRSFQLHNLNQVGKLATGYAVGY